jgi:hypothetical protein
MVPHKQDALLRGIVAEEAVSYQLSAISFHNDHRCS